MAIARTTEITATSPKSFEHAVQEGIERASKTLREIRSAWVQDQEVVCANGKITEYKVRLRVTFVLTD